MSEPGQPGASNIDPDFPQRRRPRIPSAAFARSQVSGTQEDLIPGSWLLAPEEGLVAQLVRARA